MLSPGELTPSEGEIRTEGEVGDETDVGCVNGTGKSARPFTKLRERPAPVPLVAITRGAPRDFSAKWDKRTGDPSAAGVLQDPITPSQPSSPRTASSKASNIDVLRRPQCVVHESGTAPTTCAPCSVPADAAPTTSAPNLIPTDVSLSTCAPYSIPPHTASASCVPYSIPAHAASATSAPFSIPADAGTTCAPYSVASGTTSSMFGGSPQVPPYFAYQAHRACTDAQLHHVTDIQWPYGALDGRPDPFMAPGPLLSNFPDQARDELSEFDDEEEDDVEEDGSEDLDMEVFVEEECVWVDDGSAMEESVDGPRASKEALGTCFSSTGTDDMARTNAPLTQNADNPSSVVALQCAGRVQDSHVIDHSIPLGVLRSPDTTDDLGGSVRPESTRAATEGATAALARQPFPEFVVRDTAGDVPLAEEQGFARAGDRHCAKVESDTGALVELSARSGAKEAAVVVEHAGSPIGAGGALLPEGVAASSDCAASPQEQCVVSRQNGGSSGAGSVASHETRKSVDSYDVTPLESTWHPGSRGTMLPRNQDAHGAAMMQYHGDRALIDALSARLVGVEIEFRSKMALLEEKLMESLNVGAERANELRAMEREYAADKADADAVFQRELAERNIEYRSLVVELEAKHSKEVCELREALLLAQHAEGTSKMKLDSERDFFEQDKAEQKRELEDLHSKARVLQAERDLLQKQMREQSEQHQKDFQAYERELQKAATHLLSQARPDILPAATATVSSFQISSEFDTIGRAF